MKPEVELAIGELVKHGVIHKDEIDSALEKNPESAGLDDRDALGDFLEQIGLITAFQAGELRNQRVADLVMDNYLILDRLGEGGMGTVFRARHKRMRRIVAIKARRNVNFPDRNKTKFLPDQNKTRPGQTFNLRNETKLG